MTRLFLAMIPAVAMSCGETTYCSLYCDSTGARLPQIEHLPGEYRLEAKFGETETSTCTYTWAEGGALPSTFCGVSFESSSDAAAGPTRVSRSGLHEVVSVELTRDGVRVYKIEFTNPMKVTTPSCNQTGCRSWTFDPPSA